MLIAKLLRTVKAKEEEEKLYLWEKDEFVNCCRGQFYCSQKDVEFSPFRRRHHCRYCGGIFCDSCLRSEASNPSSDGTTLIESCCLGCVAGRTPGDHIRQFIEGKIMNQSAEALAIDCRTPAMTVFLQPGCPFDSKLLNFASSSSPSSSNAVLSAPRSGFFEFINKSDSFCCIKVLHRYINPNITNEKKSANGETVGFSVLWEVCRPLYVSLPPQAAVHGYLSEGVDDLVVLLLHVNTHLAEKGITFEQANNPVPTEPPMSSSSVPKCCLIGEFRHYTAFQIRHVAGHNVLLKFKGGGGTACEVEPRMGSSVKRVGVFAKLLSSSSKKGEKEEDSSTLDFSTNISAGDIQYLHSSFRY